jgi:hypothetical protein
VLSASSCGVGVETLEVGGVGVSSVSKEYFESELFCEVGVSSVSKEYFESELFCEVGVSSISKVYFESELSCDC